jgi:hypothetical protein
MATAVSSIGIAQRSAFMARLSQELPFYSHPLLGKSLERRNQIDLCGRGSQLHPCLLPGNWDSSSQGHSSALSRSRILTGPVTLESCRSFAAATIAFYLFGELHVTPKLAASLGPFGLNRY